MREPQVYQIKYSPQRSSSIRLRKRSDEVKQQFLKNRKSGDFGYSLISKGVDTIGNTDILIDPGPVADGIQHNLRPLLRNKYRLGDVEEGLGSDWRTWGREGMGQIEHLGMIDQPPQEDIRSCHSLQYKTRYITGLFLSICGHTP